MVRAEGTGRSLGGWSMVGKVSKGWGWVNVKECSLEVSGISSVRELGRGLGFRSVGGALGMELIG